MVTKTRTPLRRADFKSDAWARTCEHIADRLAELRHRLEQPKCAPDETASLRGRIEELKNLVALEKAAPDGPRQSALLPRTEEATPDGEEPSGDY